MPLLSKICKHNVEDSLPVAALEKNTYDNFIQQ